MSILRYCYGMDSLERHRAMAAVIREALPERSTLLDVGGEANIRCNHLGRFLKGYNISTLNAYRQSDVTYEGGRLPFEDNAFDAVVSLDTAEHVPHSDRKAWIEDFFRVARKQVIMCAPWGSEYQSGVDRELNDLFKQYFGRDHHYLAEHVACTMPDIPEIKEWVGDRDYQLYFDGDARIYRCHMSTLFKIQKKGGPLKILLKLLHQFATLFDLKPLHLQTEPHPHTRRWYLRVSV